MKKILFLFIASLVTVSGVAQIETIESEFPTYQGIVTVPGVAKDVSYPKIKAWIATNFASANDVIQLDDRENGKIIVKGNTVVLIKSVGLLVDTRVYFALTIDIRDERFRYTYTVSDITSGSPARSQMRDMGRDNRTVAQFKNDIRAAFMAHIENMRGVVLDTATDDW